MKEHDKNQIQRIKDGETGPGNAKRGQPRGPKPKTDKKTIELTTLPPTADTGSGGSDKGER